MDKILTIIIPTYNMEKYLRHCLDSLIVPNMDKVEVLVINDGSKDSSSAIGHEYQDKYPQTFRVIDKENGNYGSCINRGLKEATGKYVKVLDADDSFETKSFSSYIDMLEKIDVDMVLTNYIVVNEKGQVTSVHNYATLFSINNDVTENFKDFISKNPHYHSQMHGITYNASVFDGLNYHQTEGISYTDVQWSFEPIINVKTIYYCPVNIYRYLLGRDGQTMQNQGKHIKQLIVVVKNMLQFFSDNNLKDYEDNSFFKYQIFLQLGAIYNSCLYYNAFPKQILLDFDDYLRNTYPYFFKETSSLEEHHLHLVKMWRKNNRQRLPLWFTLYRRVQHLYHSMIYSPLNKLNTKG